MNRFQIVSYQNVTNRGTNNHFSAMEFNTTEHYSKFFRVEMYGNGTYFGETGDWKLYIFVFERRGRIEEKQGSIFYAEKFETGDLMIIEKHTRFTLYGDAKLFMMQLHV